MDFHFFFLLFYLVSPTCLRIFKSFSFSFAFSIPSQFFPKKKKKKKKKKIIDYISFVPKIIPM